MNAAHSSSLSPTHRLAYTSVYLLIYRRACLATLYVLREVSKKYPRLGFGIAQLVERHTRDPKFATASPGMSGGRIFFSRVFVVVVDSYSMSVPPRVTAVASKTPRSFCQKCRWQVTPKHAYTLDPTKSKRANYAVQA